jgi:hypothetical protein
MIAALGVALPRPSLGVSEARQKNSRPAIERRGLPAHLRVFVRVL